MSGYVSSAMSLIKELGVYQTSMGMWVFTDVKTASSCYIHHSQMPVAAAAYAAVDPIFAAGRIPNYTLIDLVEKVPCMDYIEYTALAIICDAEPLIYHHTAQRGEIFGETAWQIVNDYQLESCFIKVRPYGDEGRHYTMRPQGFNYDNSTPIPALLKAMRKSYRSMQPLRQIMVLTLLHLYSQGTDKFYLIGGCPTKISAAEALRIMREDNRALATWAKLLCHYAGW